MTVQQAFDLAVQHHQAGRWVEAEGMYRQILAVSPNHANSIHHLGLIALKHGHQDAAARLIARAIELDPGCAEAHNNLGLALEELKKAEEAQAAYQHAIRLKPDYAEAHSNLGTLLKARGDLTGAIAMLRKAVALNPGLAEGFFNLGSALLDDNQPEEAVSSFKTCLSLNPGHYQAVIFLGSSLRRLGRLDEAVEALQRAAILRPDLPEALVSLGDALTALGKVDDAIASCERAIALKPDFADAHGALSMALLLKGDLRRGWVEYEWRWGADEFKPKYPGLSKPLWRGEDFSGRSLLLLAEQGLGDTLQCIRYLPMVVQRGGRVLVGMQPELVRLLSSLPGVEQWLVFGERLPQFDLQCPLMSLPGVFQTTLETIPSAVPYLFPDSNLLELWRQKLAGAAGRFKVGIVWAGNPGFIGDRTRSLKLDRLAPLALLGGSVTFFSLQKGSPVLQLQNPPDGMGVVNLAEDLKDMADTAAVMCNLDLVITTDTSVAHLAGALGRPVWVMLQFVPDWRWLLDREDSPWYPSARLFRQPKPGDWNTVIANVVDALRALVETSG